MTRGETGRGSAGPRARVLDRDDLLARRAAVMGWSAGSDRSEALRKLRCQLRAVDRREA